MHVLDLATSQETVLTKTSLDESPSFAPNGRMLLYATEVGRRGILAWVSVDGQASANLPDLKGNVREPTWGPFIK